MANNLIQIKRTTVSGRVPTNSNLKTGELAINLTDGIMYSSEGNEIFEIGANNTNINVTGNANIKAIVANGSSGNPGDVLCTDGSDIYWASFTPQISFVEQHFVGDGTTKVFDVTGGYTIGSLNVFLNGVRCGTDDCDTSSGTQVVFYNAPSSTLEIDVFGMRIGATLFPNKKIENNIKQQIQSPKTKYSKKRALKKNDR